MIVANDVATQVLAEKAREPMNLVDGEHACGGIVDRRG
jgi:hypothetical protein